MKNLYRITMYISGLLLLALGGILAIKSNLGASPVSSLPLSISKVSKMSLGTATTILYSSYVILQILILKKDFNIIQILQILFAILFGKLMNLFNVSINLHIANFYIRLFICIVSCYITAIGILFTVKANIVPIAPDGLTQVISKKLKVEFGKIKICFDCTIVVLSIILLSLNNKGIEGLGIGTILSALLVGKILERLKNIFQIIIKKNMITE